ncbi:MAG: amidohydrolase family protein [Microbacteriaceae bacterium]|nr:amidohydrolase family protein [Microbacteriaceae bacterium]
MSGRAGWLRVGAAVVAGELRHDQAVRIQDGRIAEIAAGGAAPADARHAPNATLIPGFVDAHCHLSFGYAEDHATVRRIAEDADLAGLRDQIRRHAGECLAGGVTAIRDCGDRDFATLAVRDEIRRGELAGPVMLAAGPPVTTPGGHLNWCGGAVGPEDDIQAAVDRLGDAGTDLVKVLASGGGMTAESDPHHPQFSRERLELLVRRARERGLPVAAHAHSTDAIALSVAAGVSTVEHCSWKGIDGSADVRLDVVDSIARQGIAVVLTMAGIHRVMLPGRGTDADQVRSALESSATGRLADDFAWARTLRERGCELVIASDAGVRFTPFIGFIDSVRCGIEALRITAVEAIGMATAAPARALGLADVVGELAEGRQADAVLLDGLLTPESSELPDIVAVWAKGLQVV